METTFFANDTECSRGSQGADIDAFFTRQSNARTLGTLPSGNQRDQRVARSMEMLYQGGVLKVSQYDINRIRSHFGDDAITVMQDGERRTFSRYYYVGLNNLVDGVTLLATMLEEDVELLKTMLEDTSKFYHRFPLNKRDGGRRWINAPNDDMKRVQKKILYRVLRGVYATRYAHGFVHNRSIVTNAQQHVGKDCVVKMDIRRFFDTITEKMVLGAMMQVVRNNRQYLPAMTVLSKLCVLNGVTPQGAPTSPFLSNVVCRNLDYSLRGLSNRFGATYTRYADDLTFSGRGDITTMIPLVTRAVNTHGFRINTRKTGVFRKGGRQRVTGIIVNQQTGVDRKKRMNLRARIHNIKTGKVPISDVNLAELRGHVSFVKMANQAQGERLEAQLAEIEPLFSEGSM
jgi:retron-type reverse transcriptase